MNAMKSSSHFDHIMSNEPISCWCKGLCTSFCAAIFMETFEMMSNRELTYSDPEFVNTFLDFLLLTVQLMPSDTIITPTLANGVLAYFRLNSSPDSPKFEKVSALLHLLFDILLQQYIYAFLDHIVYSVPVL